MVAAAKLRRAQDAAQNARPYAERMAAVIANLAAGVTGPGAPQLLVGTGSDQRQLVMVATADRGLAGGFNTSIVRAAREHIAAADRRRQGRQASSPSAARRATSCAGCLATAIVDSLEVGQRARPRRGAADRRPDLAAVRRRPGRRRDPVLQPLQARW